MVIGENNWSLYIKPTADNYGNMNIMDMKIVYSNIIMVIWSTQNNNITLIYLSVF